MTSTARPVALARADDEATFGGKAVQLALAAAAGLRVPDGVAVPWPLVDAAAAGDGDAVDALAGAAPSDGSLVVRSSAVGEDSATASFAGQHLTVLNVAADEVVDAAGAVWRSARSGAVAAYRRRLGLDERPRIGVVVQRMVHAEVAGVAFHPNPVTGADEVLVEASWGLGEAVVGGLVTPDLFRLSADGALLESRLGAKEVEVTAAPGGGTRRHPTGPDRAGVLTLDERRLADLHRLVRRCRRVFGDTQDVEWAFASDTLWFLQRRAVTGRAAPDEA